MSLQMKAVLLAALFVLGGCHRLVSFDPLLAEAPASSEHWDGAYLGTLGEGEGRLPMLLKVSEAVEGSHKFSIHARGPGQEILGGEGALALIGRGEARIVDLGEGFVVAQTRCEIASPELVRPGFGDNWEKVLEAARLLRELDEEASAKPAPEFLGPYVYVLIRRRGEEIDTLLGIGEKGAGDAAQSHNIDIGDFGNAGGSAGFLIAEDSVFEESDAHIRFTPGADSLLAFFRQVARTEFKDAAEVPGNATGWRKVSPDNLKGLQFSDRFPPDGRFRTWCNLSAANPGK